MDSDVQGIFSGITLEDLTAVADYLSSLGFEQSRRFTSLNPSQYSALCKLLASRGKFRRKEPMVFRDSPIDDFHTFLFDVDRGRRERLASPAWLADHLFITYPLASERCIDAAWDFTIQRGQVLNRENLEASLLHLYEEG